MSEEPEQVKNLSDEDLDLWLSSWHDDGEEGEFEVIKLVVEQAKEANGLRDQIDSLRQLAENAKATAHSNGEHRLACSMLSALKP